MKLIFLDIDGVLNNERTNSRTPDGYVGISDSLTKRLGKIIETTHAKVVLTSDWKDYSSARDTAYMRKKLARFNALPIGKTKDEWQKRGAGINAYLKNCKYESFVILDDNEFDFQEENLLQYTILTNPTVGLTNEDVNNAIKILNSIEN